MGKVVEALLAIGGGFVGVEDEGLFSRESGFNAGGLGAELVVAGGAGGKKECEREEKCGAHGKRLAERQICRAAEQQRENAEFAE